MKMTKPEIIKPPEKIIERAMLNPVSEARRSSTCHGREKERERERERERKRERKRERES